MTTSVTLITSASRNPGTGTGDVIDLLATVGDVGLLRMELQVDETSEFNADWLTKNDWPGSAQWKALGGGILVDGVRMTPSPSGPQIDGVITLETSPDGDNWRVYGSALINNRGRGRGRGIILSGLRWPEVQPIVIADLDRYVRASWQLVATDPAAYCAFSLVGTVS